VRIILYVIALILALSVILSKSPLYFLGAFGAITAVILLIFKDTILGLVAKLTNICQRYGTHWRLGRNAKIQCGRRCDSHQPEHGKGEQLDKTITTIPTYYFITESFKNWRGMQMSGGRRIKRTLQISIDSIQFVDPEMRERFKEIDIIRDHN
jgi:miniconductance mechanosensitive channel